MLKRFLSTIGSASKASNKKRLLFIRRTTGFGGSEVVILDFLKAIDYEKNRVFLASPVDVFSNLLADLKLPVTFVPLTAPFTGRFFPRFFSWIRYFMRVSPDKIILAEGGFTDFSLPTVLAAFAVARGNIWMMELHPAPERLEKNRVHWGVIPGLGLSERARGGLPRGLLSVGQGARDPSGGVCGSPPGKNRASSDVVD